MHIIFRIFFGNFYRVQTTSAVELIRIFIYCVIKLDAHTSEITVYIKGEAHIHHTQHIEEQQRYI